jgi:hypothetical protein
MQYFIPPKKETEQRSVLCVPYSTLAHFLSRRPTLVAVVGVLARRLFFSSNVASLIR